MLTTAEARLQRLWGALHAAVRDVIDTEIVWDRDPTGRRFAVPMRRVPPAAVESGEESTTDE